MPLKDCSTKRCWYLFVAEAHAQLLDFSQINGPLNGRVTNGLHSGDGHQFSRNGLNTSGTKALGQPLAGNLVERRCELKDTAQRHGYASVFGEHKARPHENRAQARQLCNSLFGLALCCHISRGHKGEMASSRNISVSLDAWCSGSLFCDLDCWRVSIWDCDDGETYRDHGLPTRTWALAHS